MSVRKILQDKNPGTVTARENMLISEIAALLVTKRIGAVMVTEGERVVGVLSERDIVRVLAEHGASALDMAVGSVMTRNVFGCRPEDEIHGIMELMTEKRIRHLPVLENDRLIGVISIGDVVKHRIAEAVLEAETLREYITSA